MNDRLLTSGAARSSRLKRAWRPWTISASVSLALHAALLVALLLWGVELWIPREAGSPQALATEVASERQAHEPSEVVESPAPLDPVSRQTTSGLDRLIQQEVEYQQKRGRELSVEEGQRRLEELAKQLQSRSTGESVAGATTRIAGALQLPERAQGPVAEAPGTFDWDSAQLHDVTKEVDEDGVVRYEGILVDRAGLTVRAELDQSEGERMHQVFETMRRFPLLRQVYASVVMSLLDRLLEQKGGSTVEDHADGKTGAIPSTPISPSPGPAEEGDRR